MLERHRVPATLYVATRFVEERTPFPAGGAPISWAALADALATGLVTVGSHTHTHALLDRLATTLVDDELDRSIELIGERLGVTAEHFAYPKATAGSPAADAAVRARFRSAALAGTRANPTGRPIRTVSPAHRSRSPTACSGSDARSEGGMALEDTLRRVLNRRRYAGATT